MFSFQYYNFYWGYIVCIEALEMYYCKMNLISLQDGFKHMQNCNPFKCGYKGMKLMAAVADL